MSADRSVGRAFGLSVGRSIGHSVGRQSVGRSLGQSVGQSVGRPLGRSLDRSAAASKAYQWRVRLPSLVLILTCAAKDSEALAEIASVNSTRSTTKVGYLVSSAIAAAIGAPEPSVKTICAFLSSFIVKTRFLTFGETHNCS